MELNWQPCLSAAALREMITQRIPGITPLLERSSLAVNGVIVGNEFFLPDSAEVALLPPVSGG